MKTNCKTNEYSKKSLTAEKLGRWISPIHEEQIDPDDDF
jgi:hypothetical protein